MVESAAVERWLQQQRRFSFFFLPEDFLLLELFLFTLDLSSFLSTVSFLLKATFFLFLSPNRYWILPTFFQNFHPSFSFFPDPLSPFSFVALS